MTDHDAREALRECPNPWCNSTTAPLPVVLKREGWRVACACGVATHRKPTEAEAIAEWNARSLPAPTPAQEVVAYASPSQMASMGDPVGEDAGAYIPLRRTPAGKFTMPLYTAPQPPAPGGVGGHPCVGCEGNPAPENNPCAVCGLEMVGIANHSPDAGGVGEAWRELDEWCKRRRASACEATLKHLRDGGDLDNPEYHNKLGEHIAYGHMRSYISGAKKAALRPGLRAGEE